MVGGDILLMIDFGYRWRDWQGASKVLTQVADSDIYFAEAKAPNGSAS